MRRLYFLLLLLLITPPGFAEEFLGEEGEGEYGETEDTAPAKPRQRRVPEAKPQVEEADPPGTWNFMLNGGSNGRGAVNATVGIEYSSNPWTGIRLVGDYDRIEVDDGSIGTSYGPTLYYVLRIPNPTIVKPSAGAGPGYIRWKRTKDGEVFSDSGSATLNAFWGAALLFTDHFGLSLQRYWVSYLGRAPKSFDDIEIDEERTFMRTSFGFFAYF